AWFSLTTRAHLQPGESVLVLGATGVVGQIAVQAANTLGASRVVAAGRDETALATLRGASATATIDDDFPASLENVAGDGFDVVVDTIFGAPYEAALARTKAGARLVTVGGSAGPSVSLGLMGLFGRTLMGHSNAMTP